MSPGNWSEEPARIVRLIDSRQPRRVRLARLRLPAACSIAPDGLFSAAADSMYCLASARSRLAEGRRRRVLVLRNSTLDTELVSPNYFEKRQYRIAVVRGDQLPGTDCCLLGHLKQSRFAQSLAKLVVCHLLLKSAAWTLTLRGRDC